MKRVTMHQAIEGDAQVGDTVSVSDERAAFLVQYGYATPARGEVTPTTVVGSRDEDSGDDDGEVKKLSPSVNDTAVTGEGNDE